MTLSRGGEWSSFDCGAARGKLHFRTVHHEPDRGRGSSHPIDPQAIEFQPEIRGCSSWRQKVQRTVPLFLPEILSLQNGSLQPLIEPAGECLGEFEDEVGGIDRGGCNYNMI